MNINATKVSTKNYDLGTFFSQGNTAWYTDPNGYALLKYDFITKQITLTPEEILGQKIFIHAEAVEQFFSVYGSLKIKSNLVVGAYKVYALIVNGLGYNFDDQGKQLTFDKGYMVSLKGYSKKLDLNDVSGSLLTISKMLKKVHDTRFLKTCLGVWATKDFTMLDLSVNVNNFNEAYDLAMVMKQESIYDTKNKKEIKINYDL
jgi:hypothetical protein